MIDRKGLEYNLYCELPLPVAYKRR